MRARLVNLALLLAVLIAGLGLMELGARWLLSDIGTSGVSGSYLSRAWYKAHPLRTNALGFRERDFTATPAPGVFRIAAVGDSFTYGSGLLEPDRVSNQIEAALNGRGAGNGQHRFEVLNFGIPGANYEEHEANLRKAIRTAHPHFLLLQWYLNDLDDPADKRPRPMSLGGGLHRQLNAVSALYGLADRAFSDAQVRLGLLEVDRYYARFADPDDPIARRGEARFHRIIEVARSAGIPIAVYMWPELTRPVGTSPNDVLLDRLIETCRAESIECIDLRGALAGERDHSRLIVNRFDTHGSAHASALATRLLVERLGPAWRERAAGLEQGSTINGAQ